MSKAPGMKNHFICDRKPIAKKTSANIDRNLERLSAPYLPRITLPNHFKKVCDALFHLSDILSPLSPLSFADITKFVLLLFPLILVRYYQNNVYM